MHMLKQEVADILTKILKPMKGKRIVDLGTGWAESALFFSQLKPSWKIYTIDGFGLYGDGRIYSKFDHATVLEIAEKLRSAGNIIQILGESSSVPWELPIDVLFIDADHTQDGSTKDFLKYSPFLKKGGIVCFDDYTQENNPANGVKNTVDSILENNNEFTLIYEGYYAAILKKK